MARLPEGGEASKNTSSGKKRLRHKELLARSYGGKLSMMREEGPGAVCHRDGSLRVCRGRGPP